MLKRDLKKKKNFQFKKKNPVFVKPQFKPTKHTHIYATMIIYRHHYIHEYLYEIWPKHLVRMNPNSVYSLVL